MKKVLVLAAFATFSMATFAQQKMADSKMEKKEMKMKEHVCSKECKDGNHSYAHGEKGHTCADACKKTKM